MRVLLCGDTPGIVQLMSHVPDRSVVGIIAASIRPQYLAELNKLSESKNIRFLIQPKWQSSDYESFRSDGVFSQF